MTFWVYQSYSICKKLLNSYPIFIKQKVIISMRFTLSEVVERYQRNIYVAAYAIVRNSDDANDVVQDTFLQYYTKIRQFESEEHIKAWLLRVAINKAIGYDALFLASLSFGGKSGYSWNCAGNIK